MAGAASCDCQRPLQSLLDFPAGFTFRLRTGGITSAETSVHWPGSFSFREHGHTQGGSS